MGLGLIERYSIDITFHFILSSTLSTLSFIALIFRKICISLLVQCHDNLLLKPDVLFKLKHSFTSFFPPSELELRNFRGALEGGIMFFTEQLLSKVKYLSNEVVTSQYEAT